MADTLGATERPRRRRLSIDPRAIAGGAIVGALFLTALAAPLLAPHDPLAQDLLYTQLPPSFEPGGDPLYFFGTDSLGRDLLSRLIFGGRIAFIVAFAAAIAACLVGSTLGLIAGYFGGWADRIISRIVDVWMAFPPVLFAILLVAVLGTGLSSVIIAIAVIDWTRFCRVIRAEAMGQARMDYVESARIAGYGRIGIMLREVLPNVVPSIVALLSLEMGIAVIVEAILSFVNLSISTDDPTWGSIIAEGRLSIHQAWWVLVFPLVTLILTVLSFSQFGEALKARFDPVLR
jgi:peptide/nickel transport system permease protein